MSRALSLMIQGTSSDAGKSVLVTALCRIFAEDGFRTAPFKSQNMALNSYITVDGKEIGRAQGVQAEAAGILATTDMNPILIKPTRENESQIVVHGEPYQNMKAKAYRSEFFPIGLKLIEEAYERLAKNYDRIVIEGAGSPAEVNLNDREMVNMRVARMTGAPVILVADIERGGVFASLVGTLQLLEPEDRDRVIGVIINKFRGDLSLLQPGLDWFEEYTGKPVLGVVPYIHNLYIDAEDSLILQQYRGRPQQKRDLDIAVIQYPRISNFTDLDPFFVEEDCQLRFVTRAEELGEPDLIILPGSKNTIEDLQYLKQEGFDQRLLALRETHQSVIVGVCGGYQMLGALIRDPYEVESLCGEIPGLQLLPIETTLEKKKVTTLSQGIVRYKGIKMEVIGYEIHMGQSTAIAPLSSFVEMENRVEGGMNDQHDVMGTYFHGIFHNDSFRHALLNDLRLKKGLAPFSQRVSFNELREKGFEQLAQHVRKHLKMGQIEQLMKSFQCHNRSTKVL
ncbi:cobyric acid synthase [Ammoniphilus sp. YIM 78166]|uniref:cobyric acid synthase n=1 Tax=Ammoniphilus sp. YIM 78166 TaxID=1644106 RepID=UPI00106F27C2|nr:cobyric acid synthase [Ammoniphilus sp. YIM 78166]